MNFHQGESGVFATDSKKRFAIRLWRDSRTIYMHRQMSLNLQVKVSLSYLYRFLKSSEDGFPQREEHEQEEVEEDVESKKSCKKEQEETEEEQQKEEDPEEGGEELTEETQQREEDECADDPECTSLKVRESDEEKSLDIPDSPRPLSQETRNLTASELLLNKSVHTRVT